MFVTACWDFTLATMFQRKVVAVVVGVQEESRSGTAAEQGRCWGRAVGALLFRNAVAVGVVFAVRLRRA